MDWEGREESSNVEDQRGGMGKTIGIAGGGGAILLIVLGLIFGIDPSQLLQNAGVDQQQTTNNAPIDKANDPDEELRKFTSVILHDTEVIWTDLFAKMGKTYPQPHLVMFNGVVNSACGQAESAMGPFYCPADHKVYIDLGFYRDMQKKLNAPGEFARAYVIAHEVGHHVQGLLGYSKKAEDLRRGSDKAAANHASVRLELQADYFAGVWAHHAQQKYKFLHQGDLDTALHAAFEIGDDRLRSKAGGVIVPDSFTHGSSKQRVRWFTEGFQTGDVERANQLFALPYEKL